MKCDTHKFIMIDNTVVTYDVEEGTLYKSSVTFKCSICGEKKINNSENVFTHSMPSLEEK